MTTPPITPAAWDRMPWHPKARLIAQMEKRLEELRTEIAQLMAIPCHHEEVPWPDDPIVRASWTDPQLRQAHAAHAAGSRVLVVRVGEREYQRRRKCQNRAQVAS